MSLSTRILLGLVLGVAAGIFFGEPMGALRVAGDAFVKLLQMTVLPYVVVSLVAGLGRLSYGEARVLALRGGALLLLLWTIAFAFVVAMPLCFPDWEIASFFSTTLVEPRKAIDFVGLYIPSNPFRSMADNMVPAVVLFSIALGIALIGMERKQTLLDNFALLSDALMRVTDFVVRLTPYGVFAIAASAAGTMTIAEFERIQVYLVAYVTFSLLMTFWVLPGLVTVLTPLRYRDVVGLSRDVMITAFATGSHFVVLPILAERSKELLRRSRLETDDTDPLVDVIIPVSYNFPHAAKILSLSFVLFAGWFAGTPLSASQYPTLAFSGVVSLFGSITLAMPFILDLFRIPEDMFQLFVATGVVNARFGTLLAAMNTLTLALLGTCAVTGALRLQWIRLARYTVVTLLLTAGLLGGTWMFFTQGVKQTYSEREMLVRMHMLRDTVPAVVHRTAPPTPEMRAGETRLDAILRRGVLRVGYYGADAMPFAYNNASGALVGFDIEMAHSLARALGVTLEFVPTERPSKGRAFAAQLNSGSCDIIMSLTAITAAQSRYIDYSVPYLDVTAALVVEDHRRGEFGDRHALARRKDLRIGVPPDPYYQRRMRGFLPDAEFVEFASVGDFFAAPAGVDAFLFAAEALASWTMLHPNYAVVVPDPPFQKAPAAYPLPRGEQSLVNYVNSWIELKQRDGTIGALYDHWVLGRDAGRGGPRWSVVRDVLGWVD